jgi:hypothetical protein
MLVLGEDDGCRRFGKGTYGGPDHAGVALNPCFVALADEGESADEAGCDELDGEDGVDLADELVPDVDGGFGDSSSELLHEWSIFLNSTISTCRSK